MLLKCMYTHRVYNIYMSVMQPCYTCGTHLQPMSSLQAIFHAQSAVKEDFSGLACLIARFCLMSLECMTKTSFFQIYTYCKF